MYKTLHKNTRRVYRPCTVHRNSDTIGCERTEPGSCSETMQEPKPVRGKQDFPLAMASWLVYLLTGWVGVWGRGWTYGLLKHGLVVGRPRHPKGWSWRALVPVSLNFSRLDSQSWTAVLQESAALSLSAAATAHTPTPTLSQTQSKMVKWGKWGATGFGALVAAEKLPDTILVSLVPKCGADLRPVAEGLQVLVLAWGHAGGFGVLSIYNDVHCASGNGRPGNLSEVEGERADWACSGASVLGVYGCQWPTSYCSFLYRSLHWYRQSHTLIHTPSRSMCLRTHSLAGIKALIYTHGLTHPALMIEHMHTHTLPVGQWLNMHILAHTRTHCCLIDTHAHSRTHPRRSAQWWTAVLMCSDRIGCFLSFPLAFPPSGDTHRCLGERDPASCGRVRWGGGGTTETTSEEWGTSCFPAVWTPPLVTLRDIWMINREYQASAASRSKWMPPNTPVALADSEMSPSDVEAQRRAQISAEEKIQRVMTEPWHLHFSDINPAHIQGSVCNLESGQRSSSAPVYNQAENVSLCAPSTDPWPTVGAIHLWKGHLSVMLSTLWIWTVVNKQQPSKGELNLKKWYCNTSISNRIIIKHSGVSHTCPQTDDVISFGS